MEVCSRYFNIFSIHFSIYTCLDITCSYPLLLSFFKLYILFPGSILFSLLAWIYTVVAPLFLNHPHHVDCSFIFYHYFQSFSDYFISCLLLPIWTMASFHIYLCGIPRCHILDYYLHAKPLFFTPIHISNYLCDDNTCIFSW